MAVNTAQIKNLLLPGLYKVDGAYTMIEKQWPRIFKTMKSTLKVESMVRNRIMGLPQLKVEGGATAFDNNMGQRWVFNAESFEVALGFSITRKSIDDNQYKSDFNMMTMGRDGLVDSFNQFKEYQAWNILNNGQTYNASIGGDGVALFSTAHPYDGGTWANTFSTQMSLNESSLLQACLNIRQNFVNEAGLKIKARPKALVVPVNLIPTADRLIKTELRPGTANNDINAIRSMPGGLTDYVVSDFLTSNFAWFVTTQNDGLVMMERIKYETSMWVDDSTDNLLVKGYERYTPTYNDPRCAWGSFPTA